MNEMEAKAEIAKNLGEAAAKKVLKNLAGDTSFANAMPQLLDAAIDKIYALEQDLDETTSTTPQLFISEGGIVYTIWGKGDAATVEGAKPLIDEYYALLRKSYNDLYVVTFWKDEQQRIVAIFSDIQDACAFREKMSCQEAYEIESYKRDLPTEMLHETHVFLLPDGTPIYSTTQHATDTKSCILPSYEGSTELKLHAVIRTADYDVAIKVANDLRERLLAADRWKEGPV